MRREVDEEFAQYVRARQHRLLRAAFLVCGDVHLAEDLLQGALVKLAARWERLRNENPDAYVRKILYRDAVSSWRRTRRESLSLFPELELDRPEPDRSAGTGERLDLLRALAQLTPKQRAVVVLRFFEDRSEADTADALGVSVGTVKSQTHAALGKLRTLLPEFAPHLSGLNAAPEEPS
jgi:RNA polymerase sigma-70 factor (sigma-E family)